MTTEWPAGEVAFVTGAASGIGLGVARAFVAAGAKVALVDIDAERLEGIAREMTDAGATVMAVPLDVTDADAWVAAADNVEATLGPVSIVSNNAGVSGVGPVTQTRLETWRWLFKINAESQFLAASVFLPRFQSRGGRAHIMNTASMAGLVPIANTAAYNASKFASVGFSFTMRDELEDTDIVVSLLLPGTTATRLSYTARTAEAKLLGEDVNKDVIDANLALLSQGADPDAVGEQVLEAMRAKQFFIITHLEWQPLVKRVHDEIDKAYAEFDGRHGPCPAALKLLEGPSPVSY